MADTTLCVSFVNRLTRRKHVNWKKIEETNLSRCLTTLDLTALGIGSTLGAGAYVITGQVAKNDAGPAVVLSFFIAAVASVLAGICYAEFGARVPKAGSAYVYTYVTVGEGLAFVIGWNLLLEYVIGSASVARTFSGYFDFMVGHKIQPWFNETLPINAVTLAPYADPMALGIILLITVLLALGAKESALVNKLFTALNLLVIIFIVVAGAFKDEPSNWFLPKPNITQCPAIAEKEDSCGEGGFAPFGFAGIVKGAATAFYAYVGFDAIATTGEEVKKPQRAIPISIIFSLLIVFVVYFLLSITVTMMSPYYLLDVDAPLARVFQSVGWPIAKHIITVGAICALSTSLLGSMFPIPRVVLAMARDGLIFRFLGKVSPRFKTPLYATVLSGSLAGIMAFLFDVEALVSMMSIGTLLAYTLVSACVLLLRYELSSEELELQSIELPSCSKYSVDVLNMFGEIIRPPYKSPTKFSASLVKVLTIIIVVLISIISMILTYGDIYDSWVIATAVLLTVLVAAFTVVISLQPQSHKSLSFKVPFVPLIPIVSSIFNIYLMVQLDFMTWLRFSVWMCIGFLIYFSYGMWHSSEEETSGRELSHLSSSSSSAQSDSSNSNICGAESYESGKQPIGQLIISAAEANDSSTALLKPSPTTRKTKAQWLAE